MFTAPWNYICTVLANQQIRNHPKMLTFSQVYKRYTFSESLPHSKSIHQQFPTTKNAMNMIEINGYTEINISYEL